jgi:hypothetical protein
MKLLLLAAVALLVIWPGISGQREAQRFWDDATAPLGTDAFIDGRRDQS